MKDQMIEPSLLEAPYPLQSLLGFELVGWDEGYARWELRLRKDHTNRFGAPHGGIYATLLDVAMGYAGSYTGDIDNKKLAMTLSMTTNFIGRPEGDLLIAEGHRIGGGRKTFFSEGRVCDAGGRIVANGTGTFRTRGTG